MKNYIVASFYLALLAGCGGSNDSAQKATEAAIEEGVANPFLETSAAVDAEIDAAEIAREAEADASMAAFDAEQSVPPISQIQEPVLQSKSRYDCSLPKTCPMMSSCEEAMYYLNTCGDTARDRDGDGVPCEKICG